MSRSLKKSFFVDHHLLKTVIGKCQKKPKEEIGTIRTNSRRSTIIEPFVGLSFEVHNGKSYQKIYITEPMIGYKMGEFVLTRKVPIHPKKVKSKTAKKGRV